MLEVDVAEEAAKANALRNQESGKTTVVEMLDNYVIETVTLKSGRVFDIESFLPEHLMLNLNSSLVKEFLQEGDKNHEESGEDLYLTRVPSAVTNPIIQLVASHIVSVPVSIQRQSQCPEGVVSIDRFTLDEIRELFENMCVLSGAPLDL